MQNVDDLMERVQQRLNGRNRGISLDSYRNIIVIGGPVERSQYVQERVQGITGLEALFNNPVSLDPYKSLGEALWRDVK